MLKIATWNVNSLSVRLPQVVDWLKQHSPDILAIQETKLTDEKFPSAALSELGYHTAFSGQKTYNGVALCSKYPIENVLTDLPQFVDPQRRILIADTGSIRVANLYVPNGQAIGSEKYLYKLDWLKHVHEHLQSEFTHHSNLVVLGDFNIAPSDLDVHDPALWEGQVLVSAKEREAFQGLLEIGFYDAYRHLHPNEPGFTWWDYRQAAFRRNMGLRIDHILMSQNMVKSLNHCDVDKNTRSHERPSDHAPMVAIFNHL